MQRANVDQVVGWKDIAYFVGKSVGWCKKWAGSPSEEWRMPLHRLGGQVMGVKPELVAWLRKWQARDFTWREPDKNGQR